MVELTAGSSEGRAGRLRVSGVATAVSGKIVAPAIAPAACMCEGAQGKEVALVRAAPTSAEEATAAESTVWTLPIMIMIWILSLVSTAW